MKELCGKMIKRGSMTEYRPCINKKAHLGQHTPHLEGMVFGNITVGKRAPDYTNPKKGNPHVRWYIPGRKKPSYAYSLLNGRTIGRYAEKRSGTGTHDKSGKIRPEYKSAHSHIVGIVDKKSDNYSRYKNMKLFPSWNPQLNGLTRGQSAQIAMRWMLENMPKPGSEYQLHVIKDAEYPYGYFAPGHIVWAPKIDVHQRKDLLSAIEIIRFLPERQFQATIKQIRRMRLAA
jgi:hypothetical protein